MKPVPGAGHGVQCDTTRDRARVSKRKYGLTDALWDRRVSLYRGRFPLPPADVDEPRTHLVSQLPVGVVDAFEVLLTATNGVQQGHRGEKG